MLMYGILPLRYSSSLYPILNFVLRQVSLVYAGFELIHSIAQADVELQSYWAASLVAV